MRLIGNILWFFFTGLAACVSWILMGILWCITIIGIPFGKQCFKIAGLVLWPFGKNIEVRFGANLIANILWFILGGFGIALSFLLVGIFWCITIIGIPFGKQCFKLAKLSLAPFGAKIS